MPLELPSEFVPDLEAPHADEPFWWLWEIVADPQPSPGNTVLFRLVHADHDIVWQSQTYYGYPISHTTLRTAGRGDLPQMELVISNVDRLLMQYLATANGFEGHRATLRLVRGDPPAAQKLEIEFEIRGSSATRDAVGMQLQIPNPFRRLSPTPRYNSRNCRYRRFGQGGCWYLISATAAFTDCSRDVLACAARDSDMADRNLPAQVLQRIGAFPGVSTSRS